CGLKEDLGAEALAELGAQHDEPGDAKRVKHNRRPHGGGGRIEALDHAAHGNGDGGDVERHQHLAHGDDDHRQPRVAHFGFHTGGGKSLCCHVAPFRIASQASGFETNRSIPNRCDRNLATSCPLTLFPALSSGGANVPRPPLPGETVTMPPPIPLLPGSPMSYSHSPEVSYSPAVTITASV